MEIMLWKVDFMALYPTEISVFLRLHSHISRSFPTNPTPILPTSGQGAPKNPSLDSRSTNVHPVTLGQSPSTTFIIARSVVEKVQDTNEINEKIIRRPTQTITHLYPES